MHRIGMQRLFGAAAAGFDDGGGAVEVEEADAVNRWLEQELGFIGGDLEAGQAVLHVRDGIADAGQHAGALFFVTAHSAQQAINAAKLALFFWGIEAAQDFAFEDHIDVVEVDGNYRKVWAQQACGANRNW